MNEIEDAIQILSRHQFRSVSSVVGEFVEKKIALATGGRQAGHCEKGFDIFCRKLGNIEVKSRNADAKSMRCTLPEYKLAILDNFILAIVKDGHIEKLLLFSKEVLLSIKSKSDSGAVYVNTKHFSKAKDITAKLLDHDLEI